MPELELVVRYSTPLLIALVLVAFAATVVIYRKTTPPVGRPRRVGLIVLRGTVLAILLFLIGEPLLHLVLSHERPPGLAILIDDSQSMLLSDGGLSRSQVIDSLLRGPLLRRLSETGSVSTYSFGDSLRVLPDPQRVPPAFDQEITDISGALLQLGRERDRTPLDAVVLISDGVHTAGHNPVYAAERLGLPVLTVGVGDSSEQRDLVLSRVLANELVYQDVRSPVDLTVRSSGFGGRRVRITLNEGTQELSAADLTLDEGTGEYAVHLDYIPTAEGLHKLTASVSRVQGELTTENNAQSFYVRVLRSRMRVLILAGTPTPDATILRLSLSEDDRFAVRLLTAQRGDLWYGGTLGASALDSADCIALVDFPSAAVSTSALERLRRTVLERHLPVLFIGGPSLNGPALRSLGDILPFSAEVPSGTERLSAVAPVEAQHAHPLLSPGGPEAWRDWEALPPVFTTLEHVVPRPGAIVLARSHRADSEQGEPFLIARRSPLRSSIALVGHGLWRWRLMGQGAEQTSDFHARFFSTAVVWLCTREESRPVRVRPVEEFFRQGEPVRFTGQVYDALEQPVENARVTVTVAQQEQAYQAELRPLGNGRYEGELYGLAEGEASYHASAVLDGNALGADSGQVSIGGTTVEYQNTRMDPALLRELGDVTGGRFIPLAQIDSLGALLASLPSYRSSTEIHQESRALWDWPVMLLVLVSLLALEWILRKRSGML